MLVCEPNTFYDMCGSKILILQSVLLLVQLNMLFRGSFIYIVYIFFLFLFFWIRNILIQKSDSLHSLAVSNIRAR